MASADGSGPGGSTDLAQDAPVTAGAAVTAAVETLTFDEALAELQRTVAELEAGGQPLEEAIALYERGVALQRHCDRLLASAELRVRRLVERAGGALAAVEADAHGEPER